MGMTAEQYRAQLQALLPQGRAWAREEDSVLAKLLLAFADELARADLRGEQLIDEADPRTTNELLADWERVAGLLDPCITEAQTIEQRIGALVGKLTNAGGQSRAYFIGLAAQLGFDITISEFRPHDVNDDVDYPLYGQPWRFAWQVNAALDTVTEFTVAGGVDDALASWGNEPLECTLERLKPAHTHLSFAYS